MKRMNRLRAFRFTRHDLYEFFICLVLAGLFVLLSSGAAFAQGNVGINNATPHAKSLLDLTSSDKGLLTPRMTAAQRTAMFPVPDATGRGMLVYQTDGSQGFYYYDGAAWQILQAGASGWGLLGNAGTSPTTNFIGTTDNQPMIVRTNNVERVRFQSNGWIGIGTNAPTFPLQHDGNFPASSMQLIRNTSPTGLSMLAMDNENSTARGIIGMNNSATFVPNTFVVGTATAHPLLLSTADNERARLLPTGEFGIGSTAPTYGLHVVRDTPGSAPVGIQCASNSGVSGVRYHGAAGTLHGVTGWANATNAYASNTLVHGTLSNTPATFLTNGTERMRIDPNGNIGIGTPAPVYGLDLQPTSGTAAMRIRNYGPTGFSGTYIDDDSGLHRLTVGISNTGSAQPGAAMIGTSTATPVLLFTQGAERARVMATGEFGIGTTAPTYGLHLVKDIAGTTPMAIRNMNNAGVSGTHYFSAGGTLAAVSGWSNAGNAYAPSSLVHGTLTNQPLTFLSNSVEQMRITPGGNVGIGTSNPPGKLSVVSGAAAVAMNIQNTNAAGSSGILFENNNSTAFAFAGFSNVSNTYESGTSTAHPVSLYTAAVERIRITAGGNVGIGTATPTATLEVNGFSKLGSNAPAVKMLKLTGTTGATEGGFVDIAHGLTAGKILSVELLIEYAAGAWVTESYLVAAEYQANCVVSAGNIRVVNHATNSGNILGKPLKILVTYEQ